MGVHRAAATIHFCYGHRLVGHAGPCRHLHGHNAVAEIACEGPLDALGMVIDFATIKSRVRTWVDEHWDHKMILDRADPLVERLRADGEPVFALAGPPTAENLAAHLFAVARDAGLPVVRVRIWESDGSCASYERASDGTTRGGGASS